MAQSSPQKLPPGKVNTYHIVTLSDTAAVTPLLSGLSIPTCSPSIEEDTAVQLETQASEAENSSGDIDGVVIVATRMSCACCAVEFTHRTEQKVHFRSDWHRYNLKLQLRGEACVTEEAFEARTGEVSSISGSDDTSTSSTEEEGGVKSTAIPARIRRLRLCDSSDTSDSEGEDNFAIMAATRRHPKVLLRNSSGQLISLYRCVLYPRKSSPNTPAELLSLAQQAKTYTRVAMVMLAGGHFSAAIFEGTQAVVHKTFHRYVVRAKRGTLQSVRDNQGSAARSGGASLRRYNEAALTQEIQELLTSWSSQLQACHLIFLRTAVYSRHIFFGGKAPIFSKTDPRIRTIPFTTGRPTFNEAKRVHNILMAVQCFDDESLVTDRVLMSPPCHLHPGTAQLLVRPDCARSARIPGCENKARDRKTTGDIVKEAEKQEAATQSGVEDSSESDRDVELVAVTEEISTENLQEFACSVDLHRNKRKKKRRKKGVQKEAAVEREIFLQTAQVYPTVEPPQLSEEDNHLKNRLYTYCKSGDITRLTQLLKELREQASHESPFAHHCEGQQLPPPPQPSIVPHTHNEENLRVSTMDSVCEKTVPGTVEEWKSETDTSSKWRTYSLSCEHQNDKSTESQPSHTASSTSSQHSVPVSPDVIFSQTYSDNAQKFSQNPEIYQNSGGVSILPCDWDSDSRVVAGQTKFETVVLGRYGDREFSLLHVAVSAGHGDVITALLDAGCDPSVRDSNGKTPYSLASTKDIRNIFRRFRANHPDRYDYDAAQIPSALTADMEQERKQREAEKRKQQKKAKQERLKERKAVEAKAFQEQKEKERFLALTDREKRALAAERRLLARAAEQGASIVLNRCFQCGVDISGKVPFEYMDFRFCSPTCLKEHRMKGPK